MQKLKIGGNNKADEMQKCKTPAVEIKINKVMEEKTLLQRIQEAKKLAGPGSLVAKAAGRPRGKKEKPTTPDEAFHEARAAFYKDCKTQQGTWKIIIREKVRNKLKRDLDSKEEFTLREALAKAKIPTGTIPDAVLEFSRCTVQFYENHTVVNIPPGMHGEKYQEVRDALKDIWGI